MGQTVFIMIQDNKDFYSPLKAIMNFKAYVGKIKNISRQTKSCDNWKNRWRWNQILWDSMLPNFRLSSSSLLSIKSKQAQTLNLKSFLLCIQGLAIKKSTKKIPFLQYLPRKPWPSNCHPWFQTPNNKPNCTNTGVECQKVTLQFTWEPKRKGKSDMWCLCLS